MSSRSSSCRSIAAGGLTAFSIAALLQCTSIVPMQSMAFAQEIQAEEDETVLGPISVTAAEVAPGGVQITLDELERANASSIRDVFETESSVQIGGGSEVARKSYINGVEDTNLNVKIDGARQVNSAFHHLGTAIIDPGLLESVRVETGVGPVDVGPGALGGSVAYQTRDGRDLVEGDNIFGGFGRYQYGTNGTQQTEVLAIAAEHDGFDILAYGSNDHGDPYEDGRDDEVVGTEPNMQNILGKLGWSGLGGERVEFHAAYLDDSGVRPNRANFGGLSFNPEPTYQEFNRRTVSLSYVDESPTDMVNPEFVLSYNRSYLAVQDAAFGPVIRRDFYSTTTSYSGKFANTFSTGLGVAETGSVTAGVDFYHDEGHGTPDGGFGGATVSLDNSEYSTNVGVFVQSRLNLADDTRMSLGVRYDQQRFEAVDDRVINAGGPSASLNLEQDFMGFMTGYGGVSSTYGGIPLGESAIYNFAGQWDSTGLSSSRAQSYKAGVRGEEGPISADGHLFFTEIFGSHDRGDRIRNRTRDLTSRGFNLSGAYQGENLFLRSTYSYSHFRADGEVLASGDASFHGLDLGHIMTMEAAYSFFDWGVTTGMTIEHAFENDSNQATPQNDYTLTNVYASYEPEQVLGLTMRMDVRNLFDTTYVDRASSAVDNSAAFPFNEMGRSVQLTARYEF